MRIPKEPVFFKYKDSPEWWLIWKEEGRLVYSYPRKDPITLENKKNGVDDWPRIKGQILKGRAILVTKEELPFYLL